MKKTTKEIIEEMEKKSPIKARRFADGQEYYSYYEIDTIAFEVFIRTLLESFGEEIIGEYKECPNCDNNEESEYEKCHYDVNEFKNQQRLKMIKIIDSISK